MNPERSNQESHRRWFLLEADKDVLQFGDQYFQYGSYPPDWRNVEAQCFGLVVRGLGVGSFGTVYRRMQDLAPVPSRDIQTEVVSQLIDQLARLSNMASSLLANCDFPKLSPAGTAQEFLRSEIQRAAKWFNPASEVPKAPSCYSPATLYEVERAIQAKQKVVFQLAGFDCFEIDQITMEQGKTMVRYGTGKWYEVPFLTDIHISFPVDGPPPYPKPKDGIRREQG